MKLTIIGNPRDMACECGSWLKHWENVTNWKPHLCAELSCNAYATMGALVRKTDGADTATYVIPLCNKHASMKDREIEAIEHIKLASAEAGEGCGKG